MSAMKIEWEPLSVLLDDGLDNLVKEHHAEVGVYKAEMPLDVNYDGYETLEQKGLFRILGVRRDDCLVGYSSFFLLPHFHYHSTPHAPNDAIFVKKNHRMSGAGIKLVEKAEQDLSREVSPRYLRITYHDKIALNALGALMERNGYAAQETVYSKIVRVL